MRENVLPTRTLLSGEIVRVWRGFGQDDADSVMVDGRNRYGSLRGCMSIEGPGALGPV